MTLTIRSSVLILGAMGPIMAGAVMGISLYGSHIADRARTSLLNIGDVQRHHMQADMMHDALRADVLSALQAKTPEDRRVADDDFREHAGMFKESLHFNSAKCDDPEVAAALAQTLPDLERYIDSAEATIKLATVDKGKASEAFPSFLAQFKVLEGRMEELSDLIDQNADRVSESSSVTTRTVDRLVLIGWGATSALTLAIAVLVGGRLVRRIRTISNRLTSIAKGDGDLATRIVGVSGNDELAELAVNFNKFSRLIHDIIQRVSKVCDSASNASDAIMSAMTATDKVVQQQTSAVQQVSAAVDQLSSSVSEMAVNTKNAAASAEHAGCCAKDGQVVVDQSIDSLAKVESAVTSGSQRVTALGKRSEQIGEIITVIRGIADQTNLLALNAAIEAARAGEHGRGFAVVAEEVRRLAEHTASATHQVAESIGLMQNETASAVAGINQGVEQIKSGVELANRSQRSLDTIVQTASQTASVVTEIASAVEEQRAASEDIAARTNEIREGAIATKSQVDISFSSASELQSQVRLLHEVVQSFTLDRRKAEARFSRVLPGSASCSLGKLINISMGGMQVSVSSLCRAGESVTYVLEIPGVGRIETMGRVVWVAQAGGRSLCGIAHASPIEQLEPFVQNAIRMGRTADDVRAANAA